MIQKHRIQTTLGRDQRINIDINQDYDILEILSLKFSQKDIYSTGGCSDYGVVVGRVSANNGFGIPNAKVSIFVPQNEIDENDPVISKLYPYKEINAKNDENYRYNLLPRRKQHPGHTPTGTFFDQEDILTREEYLEVFEKYYNFTVKTNSAGDFMIWGVPVGTQILHVDIDLSDIGCFSLRPYDFIKKGHGEDQFERFYKFKSSSDIDGLPQIVTFDKTIEVFPLWGSQELCDIGITRSDFDLTEKDIVIQPISLILISSITDDNSDAVKRNGRIRKNSGYKCNLQTTGGKIECVRFTGNYVLGSDGVTKYPELEYLNIPEVIDDNGVAMAVLPMNMEYTYTNEFGEEEITNDTNKGIPTTSIARFRLSLNFDSHKVSVGKYLVPNIREFNPVPSNANLNAEYYEGMITTYQFSDKFEDYLTIIPPDGVTISTMGFDDTVKNHKKNLMLGTNNNGIPEDYFYKFIFGKVYTVSSFQGTHYETSRKDSFLGIKEIRPNVEQDCSSKTNYIPTNFAFRNRTKFNLIIAQVLLFIQFILHTIQTKVAELFGKFFYDASKFFFSVGIGRWRPFRRFSQKMEDLAYRIQDRFTQQLALTIYPDCEECATNEEAISSDISFEDAYCRIGEIKCKMEYQWDSWHSYIGRVRLLPREADTTPHPEWVYGGSQNSWLPQFSGETASEGCPGAFTLTYASLDDLGSYTVVEDGVTKPRFVGVLYGLEPVDPPGTEPENKSIIVPEYDFEFSDTIGDAFHHRFYDWENDGMGIIIKYGDFAEATGIDMHNDGKPITNTFVVLRIYDRAFQKQSEDTEQDSLETGCKKYDKVYNEEMVYSYLWSTGSTYESPLCPTNPPSYTPECPGFVESLTAPADTRYNQILSTIISRSGSARLPYRKNFSRIGVQIYDRKTKSGLSEFRDGVFTIVPVIQGRSRNTLAILEWYRRKRVGLFFCGGVVNYSFIDNWLHGVLYFFKFDKRIRWDNESVFDLNQRGSKYPRELVFYNVLDKTFYYRCTPYQNNEFVGQTYSNFKEILHPTTFYDLGVRDEFLYEICTDPRIDPTCSVVRDITSTSYQDPANIVEYAINYRLDITAAKFKVDEFFSGQQYGDGIKVFDGDITQLMSINCEAGIEAFDLDSPHYHMYNGEMMDPEDPAFGTYFKKTVDGSTLYGPTPIDLKLDNDGAFIRTCLNYRLGDYSQRVPFYLWNKGDMGFGAFGSTSDNQKWDKSEVVTNRLQGMFSVSGRTDSQTNYIKNTEEQYILKPMTTWHSTFSYIGEAEDMLERFEVISVNAPTTVNNFVDGDLWLQVLSWGASGYRKDPLTGILWVVVNNTWVQQGQLYVNDYRETFVVQTVNNYWGTKQVLSTPFLFYFGLKPEKTSVDILLKYFGPKGAFEPEHCPAIPYVTPPEPSVSPTPSPTITPTPSLSPGAVPPSPTPSLTPTPSPVTYYYRLNRCIDNVNTYYTEYPNGFLSAGTAVWGASECDPNSAYVVIGSTIVESDYNGYTKLAGVSISAFPPCYDCNNNPITPPPPPVVGTWINLAHNYNEAIPTWDAFSTCNSGYYNAEETFSGYIDEPSISPYQGYTVYTDSSKMEYFPTGHYWGIAWGDDPVVHYVVYIGENGSLSGWTPC